MITIKSVLDDVFIGTIFDESLGNKVNKYILNYTHTNRDNLEFFSSNLLGVQPVRYTDRQILEFFTDVLDVEYLEIKQELTKVKSINQSFKVTSDVFNITLVYVTHKFLTSRVLKSKLREFYAKVTMSIFFYRTLAVLVAHGFKYNANKAIVEAAFNNLNNKYIIKKLGSWNKVVTFRTDNVLDIKSKHYDTLVSFLPDDKVLYVISDSQGSIKVLFKNYYSEIVKAKDNGDRLISVTNTVIDIEGNDVYKDKVGGTESDILKLLHVLSDKDGFVKRDLLPIIADINKNANITEVREFLVWLSDNYTSKHSKDIEKYLRDVLIYSFEYMRTQRTDVKSNDLPLLLLTLRNVYVSSRNKDPYFLDIKKLGDKLMKSAKLRSRNTNTHTANRTSVQLYLVLLSYTLST